MRSLPYHEVMERTVGLRSFENEISFARRASSDGLHRLPQAAESRNQADECGFQGRTQSVRGVPPGHPRKAVRQGDITRCAECHTSMKWKPSLFDHEKG